MQPSTLAAIELHFPLASFAGNCDNSALEAYILPPEVELLHAAHSGVEAHLELGKPIGASSRDRPAERGLFFGIEEAGARVVFFVARNCRMGFAASFPVLTA
jgi:hypothetical protein